MSTHQEWHGLMAGETMPQGSSQVPTDKYRLGHHVTVSRVSSLPDTILDGDDLQKQEKQQLGHAWRPGVVGRSLPWRGLLALLGCLAGIIAIAVVLTSADGSEQADWTVSPTVILSALLAVTNMLARFAFSNGVRIAWWREALHLGGRGGGSGVESSGTTVGDLQACWSHADSLVSALCAGRRFGIVALASIAVTLIAIDQPLLQRAVTVTTSQRTSPVAVTASLAPEIPWGYTGYQNGRGNDDQLMTDPMVAVFNAYNSRDSIVTAGAFSGCPIGANCTGLIDAAGLAPECNTTTRNITYWGDQTLTTSNVGQTESPFSIVWGLGATDGTGPAPITLDIVFSRSLNSSQELLFLRTEHSCRLYSATLRYNMTLSSAGMVSLLGGDDSVSSNATVVSRQPPSTLATDGAGDYSYWTLGGLYLAAKLLFTSNVTYTWGGGIGIYLTLPDAPSYQFLNSVPSFNSVRNTSDDNVSLASQPSWEDPKNFILSALDTMAFMLSLSAASTQYRNTSAPPTPRTWDLEGESIVTVYRIDRGLLVSGIVTTAVLILLVVPTFVGWWELGRPVSLDPIETAKAFDAPLLRGPGSNAPIRDLIATMGARRLKWGDVGRVSGDNSGARTLGFSRPELASPPKSGVTYG